MKRSGFVINGEITIDEFRFGVKKLNNIVIFLSFDVPEEVLVGIEATSNALDSSHIVYVLK